jgi:hypothetical protein
MENFRNDCICSNINQAFQNLIDSIVNLRLLNRNINTNGLSINDSGINQQNPSIDLNINNNEILILVIIIISLMSILLNKFKAKIKKKEKSCEVNQRNN